MKHREAIKLLEFDIGPNAEPFATQVIRKEKAKQQYQDKPDMII
jgi:hypothetical protein